MQPMNYIQHWLPHRPTFWGSSARVFLPFFPKDLLYPYGGEMRQPGFIDAILPLHSLMVLSDTTFLYVCCLCVLFLFCFSVVFLFCFVYALFCFSGFCFFLCFVYALFVFLVFVFFLCLLYFCPSFHSEKKLFHASVNGEGLGSGL